MDAGEDFVVAASTITTTVHHHQMKIMDHHHDYKEIHRLEEDLAVHPLHHLIIVMITTGMEERGEENHHLLEMESQVETVMATTEMDIHIQTHTRN